MINKTVGLPGITGGDPRGWQREEVLRHETLGREALAGCRRALVTRLAGAHRRPFASASRYARAVRLVLVLFVFSGCLVRGAEDAGRPCGRLEERSDGGLFFTLSLCPMDGSIYFDVRDSIALETSDGGPLPFSDGCRDCGRCPNLAFCDSFGVGVAEAGKEQHLLRSFDGRLPTGLSTCATTGDQCEVRVPLEAGAYQARFCISRSADQHGASVGPLGPLECKVVPFELPTARGVWASFE